MRRILSNLAVLCTVALASTALAQPTTVRRRPPPARRVQAPPPPGHAPRRDRDRCASQRGVLAQEEQQLDRYRADLAGMDAELVQLKRRIDELSRQRADTARTVNSLQARVNRVKSSYDRQCSKDESCDQYEALAASLGQQGSSAKAQLRDVRTDIQTTRSDIDRLEGRIEPLRREYQQLQCNNLVPGETPQSTIDRCSAIFSDWNSLQANLNRMNSKLPMLKSRYEELLSQLRSIQSRAQGYESYLARNCASSTQLAVMREYDSVRRNAETLGSEIDQLINKVTRLRGVRIIVSPK